MAITIVTTGVVGSAINGSSVTLTLPSSVMRQNDYVVVCYCQPQQAGTLTVVSSAGTAYTSVVAPFNSTGTLLRMGVWGRIMPAAVETQAICNGTGNANDGITAVALIFRSVSTATQLDVTATSSTGSSTTPTSPAITVSSCSDVIISCVCSAIADATVTAPSSFLNQRDTNASDTASSTTGIAYLTLKSTSAFTPGGWSNFTTAQWCSATVALRADLTGDQFGGSRGQYNDLYPEGKEVVSY